MAAQVQGRQWWRLLIPTALARPPLSAPQDETIATLKRAVTEHLHGVQALELRAAEAEQRAADAEQWVSLGRDELARLQTIQSVTHALRI